MLLRREAERTLQGTLHLRGRDAGGGRHRSGMWGRPCPSPHIDKTQHEPHQVHQLPQDIHLQEPQEGIPRGTERPTVGRRLLVPELLSRNRGQRVPRHPLQLRGEPKEKIRNGTETHCIQVQAVA